jgi:hypothetical protein
MAAVAHGEVSQLGVKSAWEGGPSGGDKATDGAHLTVVDEAEHRRRPIELAVVVVEIRIGEETAPGIGEYGETEKACGLIWREAEEDLMDKFVRQIWRERRHDLQIWRECHHDLQIWRRKRVSPWGSRRLRIALYWK